MIKRRAFLALAAVATLSACAAPLLDEQAAHSVRVVKVDVDVSGIAGVMGREITVAPEQIQRDVRATVFQQLKTASVGTRDVNAVIALDNFRLVSPGQSLLVGGVSSISGVLTVTDATTGEVVVPATKVFGTAKGGWAPGGIVGAITKANVTPEQDYRATVAGFSADVRKRLLGVKN